MDNLLIIGVGQYGAVVNHNSTIGEGCHINCNATIRSNCNVPEKTKLDCGEVF